MPKKVIVLDPGHGGTTDNKGYSRKYSEKNGCLDWCLRLEKRLSSYFDVYLTRREDVYVSLNDRAKFAHDKGAILLLSVHSDGVDNPSASGTSVYESVNRADEGFAEELGTAIANCMGIRFRGAKEKQSTLSRSQDYYTIINMGVYFKIPHVMLLERAFHSNPIEEQMLLDDKMIQNTVEAAAKVIIKWMYEEEKEVKEEEEVIKNLIIFSGDGDKDIAGVIRYKLNAYMVSMEDYKVNPVGAECITVIGGIEKPEGDNVVHLTGGPDTDRNETANAVLEYMKKL